MILIDHLIGYEGGKFLIRETDGIIKNGTILGFLMLIPVFLVWFIALLIAKFQRFSPNKLNKEKISSR